MTGISFRLDIAICGSAVGHLNHAAQLTLTCLLATRHDLPCASSFRSRVR